MDTPQTAWGKSRHIIRNGRVHDRLSMSDGILHHVMRWNVESTVNEVVSKRFCKKQQIQWSKEGAHLLLQTRVRTLNGELTGIFKRWYPDLDMTAEEIPIAA
jgi:hypothetical protein